MGKKKMEMGESTGATATAVLDAPVVNEPAPDLFGDLAGREHAARAAYADLAATVARDETVSPEQAAGVLAAARKSAGDLQVRVGKLRRLAELDDVVATATVETSKRVALDAERGKAIQAELADWRELDRSQKEAHGRYMNAIGLLDAAARKREVAVGERAALDKQLAAEVAGPAAPAVPLVATRQQQGGFSHRSVTFPQPVPGSSCPGVLW
jgi:hypothetical protein